ncbi:MAG: hypothetical protein H7Y13_03115 [Sphingobacteriaceae bacterium]|nr:hypothetical protein [Sphingobacteriaceae bacterium]
MEREKSIKLFSIIFLAVFFMKMVISAAPLIISHFDKKAVNAVIMQLEIENHAKSNDVKETSVKEYFTMSSFRFTLLHPTQLMLSEMITVDHDKHIRAFYPPVPTPPPNV